MVDFFGIEMLSAEYVGNNVACHKFSFLSGPSLQLTSHMSYRGAFAPKNLTTKQQILEEFK